MTQSKLHEMDLATTNQPSIPQDAYLIVYSFDFRTRLDRNGTLDRGLKTQHGCVSFAKSVEVDASPPFLYGVPMSLQN